MSVRSLLLVLTASAMAVSSSVMADEKSELKVLLITGGCCHDYDFQSKQLPLTEA